jgi:hypothetical protein
MPDAPRRLENDRSRPPATRGRHVHIELKGPLGCLAGSVVLLVVLALLAVAVVAGLIAVAAAFWIAAMIVAIGILTAILRSKGRP